LERYGRYAAFRGTEDFLYRYCENMPTLEKLAEEQQQVSRQIAMIAFSNIEEIGANKALSWIKNFVRCGK
jgi:hypothetical protein